MKFLCNRTPYSYQIGTIRIRRNSAQPLSEDEEKQLATSCVFEAGLVTLEDKMPDDLKSQPQKMNELKDAAAAARKETEELKKEALDEIAKRDKRIAELEAKLGQK